MTRKFFFPIIVGTLTGAALLAVVWPRARAAAATEPAAGHDAAAAVAAADAPLHREALIRRVYAAYSERAAAAGGEPVEFVLDGFRVVDERQFDEVAFYPDLATLAGDWELASVIHVALEDGSGERRISFRPAWRRVEEPPSDALLGRSAREILDLGGRRFPSRRRVDSLISYRVGVVHNGMDLTYRAVARWSTDEDGTPAFSIADNVVPEVGLALDDGRGLGSLLDNSFTLAGEPREAAALPPSGRCEPSSTLFRIGQPGGVENATAAPPPEPDKPAYLAEHACTCAADCSARCEVVSESAFEGCRSATLDGDPAPAQRALAVAYTVDQSVPPGVSASCLASLRCELLACPDGTCGEILVRVEDGPAGTRLDTRGGSAGAVSAAHSYGCASCSPI